MKAEKRKLLLYFTDRFTLHNVGCEYPEMENLLENETYDAII
jgi:hypothetical protein